MRRIALICITACLAVTAGSAAAGEKPHASGAPAPGSRAAAGPMAYQVAVHLSGKIGSRPSGSRNERRAHDYVAGLFRTAGLDVRVEPFTVSGRGQSRNVV